MHLRRSVLSLTSLLVFMASAAFSADSEVTAYLQKIQAAGMSADMKALFDMDVPASGPADPKTLERLGKQYGDLVYRGEEPDTFLPLTRKTAELLSVMRSKPDVLAAHNLWSGSNLPAAGPIPVHDLKPLYDLTGDPQFSLNDYVRLIPLAKQVWDDMQVGGFVGDFNLVFDAKVVQGEKAPSTEVRGMLMGIVGGYWGDHVQMRERFNFLNVLAVAAEHFRGLQARPGQLSKYNHRFSSYAFPKLPAKGGISDVKAREKLLSLAAEAVRKNVPMNRYLSDF